MNEITIQSGHVITGDINSNEITHVCSTRYLNYSPKRNKTN